MPGQVNLTVDKSAEVGGFTFDQDAVKSLMAIGASQSVDLDANDCGGLEVRDQYGRKVDISVDNTIGTHKYFVEASSSDPSTIQVVANKAIYGEDIEFKALKEGTATITFALKAEGSTNAAYTATANFAVVKDNAIVDYTIDKVDAFYAAGTTTARDKEFGAWLPNVYGKLSNGALVALPSDNVNYNANGIFSADENAWKVLADPTKMGTATEAKGVLAATITDANGRMHAVSTEVVAKKELPVVKSAGVSVTSIVSGNPTGAVKDGDDAIVTAKAFNEKILNKCLTRYDAQGGKADRALVFFWAKDQYGTKGVDLNKVMVEESTDNKYEYKDGKLVLKAGKTQAAGDKITVAAAYGDMVSRIRIVVEGTAPVVPPTNPETPTVNEFVKAATFEDGLFSADLLVDVNDVSKVTGVTVDGVALVKGERFDITSEGKVKVVFKTGTAKESIGKVAIKTADKDYEVSASLIK